MPLSVLGKTGTDPETSDQECRMRRKRDRRVVVSIPTRNYKFTNKKHPAKAICAIALGCISLIGILAVIWLSFLDRGATKPGYGFTGLFAVLFTITGTTLGILSFRDRDAFYVLSWVGTILNLVVLAGIAFLFSLGI